MVYNIDKIQEKRYIHCILLKVGFKMKKIFLVLISVTLVLSLAACGDSNLNEETTQAEVVEVSNATGGVTVSEDTFKEIIALYPAEVTGLNADVYDYSFNLSAIKLNGKDACKAEAFIEEGKVEATFALAGLTLYKYNETAKAYNMLTLNGPADETLVESDETLPPKESTTASGKTETTLPIKTDEQIKDENNSVLHKRYAEYDLSKVGLEKPITSYEFQVTGTPAVAADGSDVYVIYLLENGEYTNYKFAINNDHDYYYNTKTEQYEILK